MDNYVTEEKFEDKCKEITDQIADVRDNHLAELNLKAENCWGAIEFIMREIKTLRWTVVGWGAVLAIVWTILEVRVG